MFGDLIIVGRTVGGHRDYLANEPISAGAGIDLRDDGLWVPGRYEADFTTGEAWFIYNDAEGKERWLLIDRLTMRFRWPVRT